MLNGYQLQSLSVWVIGNEYRYFVYHPVDCQWQTIILLGKRTCTFDCWYFICSQLISMNWSFFSENNELLFCHAAYLFSACLVVTSVEKIFLIHRQWTLEERGLFQLQLVCKQFITRHPTLTDGQFFSSFFVIQEFIAACLKISMMAFTEIGDRAVCSMMCMCQLSVAKFCLLFLLVYAHCAFSCIWISRGIALLEILGMLSFRDLLWMCMRLSHISVDIIITWASNLASSSYRCCVFCWLGVGSSCFVS